MHLLILLPKVMDLWTFVFLVSGALELHQPLLLFQQKLYLPQVCFVYSNPYAMFHYKWCLGTAWLSSFVKSPYTCLYTFTYKLKTVTALLWERYEILIFCVVMAAPSNSLSFHSDIIMPDWPSPFIPKEHCCRVFWLFKSVQFNSIPHSGILRAVFPVLLLTS